MNVTHTPTVLCLMGPTGTGKSALASAIAERLPAEIVSVDSAMIYRGMDVGTDKPSAAVRKRVPHHLIDICDPAERYSAGAFARDALAIIRAVVARGRLPILAGGTFLYFRALTSGFSPMPAADASVRSNIQARAEKHGWETLHAELAQIDPSTAHRIAPADRQRIERALELYHLTGQPPSRLHATPGESPPYDFLKVALWPEDRNWLGRRLEARFEDMLQGGLVDEVRCLHARGDLDVSLPSVRAVGYRQLWGWLEGEYSFAEARRRAVVATRRYAKRQMTWLRSEHGVERIRPGETALDTLMQRLSRGWCARNQDAPA